MKFYIHTWPPCASAGVRATYVLADELNKRGVEARTEIVGVPVPDDQTDAIHIYPETLSGNPAKAERVVRWALNVPGRLTGVPMGEDPDDLIVTWIEHFVPGAPRLQVDINQAEVFYPKATPGRGCLLWVYKGTRDLTWMPEGAAEINPSVARTRESVADLLRATDLVYSCDPCSSLNTEATLCGTPVLFSPTAARQRESPSFWGEYGFAYHPDELPRARAEVALAAPHFVWVREHIAKDIDKFITLCGNYFEGDYRPSRPRFQGAFLHG